MEGKTGANSPYTIDEIIKNPTLLENLIRGNSENKYFILSSQ